MIFGHQKFLTFIYIHIFIVFHQFYFFIHPFIFYLCFTFSFIDNSFLYLFYSLLYHIIKKLNLYHYNLNILLLYYYLKNSFLFIIVHYFFICFFSYYFIIILLSYTNEILQYSVGHSTYLCFVECCRSKFNILKFVIGVYIGQKMKFSIKDFFSNCDQIRNSLRIWSHLLKKSLMENFIFCAVLGLLLIPLKISLL